MMYISFPDVRISDYVFYKLLAKRRSVRKFKRDEISMKEIGEILWAADGISDSLNGFRTAPSAGALYPVDVFIFIKDGIYRYLPEKHGIEIWNKEDRRRELKKACLNQDWVFTSLVIVLVGFPERITPKYGDRGIRYIYLEAGHIAQNIHLAAVNLGMGSVPVGAFYDDEVKKILGIKNCLITYVIPVGKI